mmetsp:Transcript_17483/g.44358  ORF Transcript_17483/g.44358 Transcript_17483/m.44358 type:complete len:224 (+) Transcript_17483:1-672(+)
MAELDAKRLLSLTYWVCAFSVNQHSSICSGFGAESTSCVEARERYEANRRDSVLGEIYPLCPCQTAKHLNSDTQLCELNKFESMMEYLAAVVPEFRQVVVVDEDFNVFSRAWVVSELAVAHRLKIPQKLKMRSASSVDRCRRHHGKREIKIEECQASWPADKADILAKIENIPEFNRTLNRLIFGEQDSLLVRFSTELAKKQRTRLATAIAIGVAGTALESVI